MNLSNHQLLDTRDAHGPTRTRRAPPRSALVGAEVLALGVVAVSMVGFGAVGWATGATGTVTYLGTVAALVDLVVVLREDPLPPALAFALAALVAGHLAGGLVPVGHDVLYNADAGHPALRYDHLVHGSERGLLALAGSWVATLGLRADEASRR